MHFPPAVLTAVTVAAVSSVAQRTRCADGALVFLPPLRRGDTFPSFCILLDGVVFSSVLFFFACVLRFFFYVLQAFRVYLLTWG